MEQQTHIQDIKSEERLQAFGDSLSSKKDETVAAKVTVEDRWLDELRQYHGVYSSTYSERLKAKGGSQVFVNITRNKTKAVDARLTEMLFPTDDKNWGIKPTPIPETPNNQMAQPLIDNNINGGFNTDELAKANFAEAKAKAKAMEREIDDQLNEAKYNEIAREVIRDACILGTGIIRGPIIQDKTSKSWQQLNDGVFQIQIKNDLKAGIVRVDPWDYFPDMSALSVDDAEFTFEREFLNKKDLIQLAKSKLYLKNQIRKVLAEGSKTRDDRRAEVREMILGSGSVSGDRYELWRYTGEIERDDLISAGVTLDGEVDPLDVHYGTVWFIGQFVIRVALNPMEAETETYSVFNLEKDDASVFGFGVPYLMRDSQRVINTSWRMILDNAGASVMPQGIINSALIQPANGSWKFESGKLWLLKDKNRNVREAMDFFNIPNNQNDLQNIFVSARQLADEETNMPLVAQGEAGPTPETATGRSILMNSANIMIRRAVKLFDDNVTKPLITRFYHWNMQFNDNEQIKGDFAVDARGSSALLERDQQAQNIQSLMPLVVNPVFLPLLKPDGIIRKFVQSLHLSEKDILKSEEEIASEMQAQQQQQPEVDIMKMRELEVKQAESQLKYDVEMAKLALERDTTVAKLETDLEIKRGDQQVKSQTKDIESADKNKEMRIKLLTGQGI